MREIKTFLVLKENDCVVEKQLTWNDIKLSDDSLEILENDETPFDDWIEEVLFVLANNIRTSITRDLLKELLSELNESKNHGT